MSDGLLLDGRSLTIAALAAASAGSVPILVDETGLARMAESHAMVLRAIAEDRPVYGVTTGLGARSTERISVEALARMSLDTIRGRAHAVGAPESRAQVRAAMIIRLNTLLSGYSGAGPGLAGHLRACLNAGITPVVGEIGSVGVADLVWNATLALGLLGEGPVMAPSGIVGPGADVLRHCGVAPWLPGPRDGLAIASHSCGVAATASLALFAARRAFEATQTAAALSTVGFVANLTPFLPHVLACSRHPGHAAAAEGIRQRLAGSGLMNGAPARRLQDPLSIRNIPQIHGTVVTALETAETTLHLEINGCSDNPVALIETDEILSCGAYFTAHLAHVLEGVSRAFVPLATAQIARMAKLLNPEFSGLPLFLAATPEAANGFAPLMKTAEALLGELLHEAQPAAVWPSISANGVEDVLASSPVAARALGRIAQLSMRLSAIEVMVAAQAVDLRGDSAQPGERLARVHALVRGQSAPLATSRPLGGEVEAIAALIGEGGLDWPLAE